MDVNEATRLTHWETCFHYFMLEATQGHWEHIHHSIRDMVPRSHGKKKQTCVRLTHGMWRYCHQGGRDIIKRGGFDTPVQFFQVGMIHAWYARLA